jgi:small subunit ribosomal protein S18
MADESVQDTQKTQSNTEENKDRTDAPARSENRVDNRSDTRSDNRSDSRSDNRSDSRNYRDRRDGSDDRDGRSFRGGGRRPFFKKKVCRFCTQGIVADYKNPELLRRFITERGKILPRRITGTCAKHQRALSTEIKRARVLAYIPFVKK